MHVFAAWFFPFTHYFFRYNQLLKKRPATNEKRKCKKEIWQAHGKRDAPGPTLKDQECKFRKQLSFYLCMYFEGSSPNRRTLRHYANRRTSFFQLFLCSHQKTVGCRSQGSCIQGFSWGSGKPLGSWPQVPQHNPLVHEPSLQHKNLRENS